MENKVVSNKIVINLQQSSNAAAFENENIIHKREFDHVKMWINDRLSIINNEEKHFCSNRYRSSGQNNNAITILGSRGSGKTSFILSVLNSFSNNSQSNASQNNECKDVAVLELIDPTMIEEKGHIFLTLISLIKNMVEKKMEESDCDFHEKYNECIRQNWRKSLKSLSAGLPSVDGVCESFDGWQDPEFVMEKGLFSVSAAKKLAENFECFVKLSLDILKKTAFLVAFDDIDIDFRRGWMVLETIRKYLTTPYVITILSGDLKLFSKAVRKQQWKNFGKAILINECDKQDHIKDYDLMVTEMESQYLQKVLKPQWRINLKFLSEMRENCKISASNNVQPISIDDYYSDFLSTIGIHNLNQKKTYISYLISLPIRTQIQILLTISQNKSQDFEDIDKFSIISPLISDFSEKRLNIDVFRSNSDLFWIAALDLLLHEDKLLDFYQFQPITLDTGMNACMFAISVMFAKQLHHHENLIFDYFLRIGYLRNITSLMNSASNNRDILNYPTLEGICRDASLLESKPLRNIGCNMASYIRALKNYHSIMKTDKSDAYGTIILPGLASIAKKNSIGRIDDVLKGKPMWIQCVGFLPLSIAQPYDKQDSLAVYSIYTLLASIGELLYIRSTDATQLINNLAQLSQVRSFVMPNLGNSNNNNNDPVLLYINIKEYNSADDDLFINTYLEWQNVKKSIIIPPYMLGKVSTRLFYALQNLEQENSSKNLGDAMHRRIIIVLNSILVETTRELSQELLLSKNNPITADDIFIYNLKKINEHIKSNPNPNPNDEDSLNFARWMLSCPLLYTFLNFGNSNSKTSKKNNLIDCFFEFISVFNIEKISKENITKISVYNDLINVNLIPSTDSTNSTDKIYFSTNSKKWSTTLNGLKEIYVTPTDFCRDDNNVIKSKLKDRFKNINVKSIGKIKNRHEGKTTWLQNL